MYVLFAAYPMKTKGATIHYLATVCVNGQGARQFVMSLDSF